MTDSYTSVYLKPSEHKQVSVVEAFAQKFKVTNFESLASDKLIHITFESYEPSLDKQIAKLTRKLIENSDDGFVRVRYCDEYANEIFWMNLNGKLKEYAHGVELENAIIVKAYRHWHTGMGDVWDGHFDRKDIDRMSIQYGNYDNNGKKIKTDLPDYIEIVKSKKSFTGEGLAVPHASSKWDYHIPIFESYAAVIIAESDYAPENKKITFERTFIMLNEYDSTVIGYLWSWTYQENPAIMLITCHGDLAVKVNILINHDQLTLDELIFIDIFQQHIDQSLIGNTQHISDFEQVLYPPSVDYLYYPSVCKNWKHFTRYERVFNLHEVQLKKTEKGIYRIDSGDPSNDFDIIDIDFTEEMKKIKPTKANYFYLQIRLIEGQTAHKVLKVKVSQDDKYIYKRFDELPATYQLL